MYTGSFQRIPRYLTDARPEESPVPTFSDVLSCAGGPAPSRGGGGGARRFFMSDLTEDTPEMLLSERDGPNVMEREFTDGEFGVVKQPCGGRDRHEMSSRRDAVPVYERSVLQTVCPGPPCPHVTVRLEWPVQNPYFHFPGEIIVDDITRQSPAVRFVSLIIKGMEDFRNL